MKVYIDEDEMFPVYSITDYPSYPRTEIEVDEATVERWQRIIAEFDAVQSEMEATWEARRP